MSIPSNEIIINETANYVRYKLYGEASGHDWWHVFRVWKQTQSILKSYKHANPLIAELSALLHDLYDWKEYKDSDNANYLIRKWLSNFEKDIKKEEVDEICYIIDNISFKGIESKSENMCIEGQIVQDADRLDAMGAMGIARTFAYGGKKNQVIYDPDIRPSNYKDKDDYIANHDDNTAINHFYEKLLLIGETMNTESAKKIASGRHEFMLEYLEQFYNEFDGKL